MWKVPLCLCLVSDLLTPNLPFLTCLGCHNKIARAGPCEQQRRISPSSGGWKSEIRVPAWLGSDEGSFFWLADSPLLTVCSPDLLFVHQALWCLFLWSHCFYQISAPVCVFSQSDSLWPHQLSSARLPCPWNFFQARILDWVAMSSSRGSSWPRDRTQVSCIGRQILYYYATWEARPGPHPYELI